MDLLVRRYEMWRGVMEGTVGSAKPRRVQMFLCRGGLEDTAACEVSLVSVLLRIVSVFVSSTEKLTAARHVTHSVFNTHGQNVENYPPFHRDSE